MQMLKSGLRDMAIGVAAALTVASGASAQIATGGGQLHVMGNTGQNFNGPDVNTLLGANRFYNAGITGQGAIAANVEAGHVWNGHDVLGHVSQFVHHPDAAGSTTADLYDDHATAVGHHLAGRAQPGASGNTFVLQSGIAYDADLRSGAIATSFGSGGSFSINTNTVRTAYDAYFGTADVINSSWGSSGSQSTAASADYFGIGLDGYANTSTTTTFVTSAGNSGSSGPNSVGSAGSGYNSLSVAALDRPDLGYDRVAGFSSYGPQDYWDPTAGFVTGVRAPVDIAAPGVDLHAAFYTNDPSSIAFGQPSFYNPFIDGTSFASPIVAGGVALLHSGRKADATLSQNADAADARVVKAIMLNSADKVLGRNGQAWDNGQQLVGGVIETTQSLDYDSGAGRMNLDRLYDQFFTAETADLAGVDLDASGGELVGVTGWDFAELDEGGTNVYQIAQSLAAGSLFNVTLNWFRERAQRFNVNAVDDFAFANLDLRVVDTLTGLPIAQSISVYNEVEHLSFQIPAEGFYRIEVDYVGDLFDVTGGWHTSEQYGLAWWGTGGSALIPEPLAAGAVLVLTLMPLRRPSREGVISADCAVGAVHCGRWLT
ncbi:MAG: S8 family serine peptidase [Planctomycetota bacterium]